MKYLLFIGLFLVSSLSYSQNPLSAKIDKKAKEIEADMIKWRRHLHENPELSNREFNTAKYIAAHLKTLGLKVDEGMAITGVVAVLETGKPGPIIGLRADTDGLPVKERVDLPFASKATGDYKGEMVPVMHACGHDTHVAILMATASVLTEIKKDLKGKVVFVFQPAEEGAPAGEEGGAALMIKEGIFEKYGIEVFFGLHISSNIDVNTISYKTGGIMAAQDVLYIKIKGKQTHGSRPWAGVDPITTAAQVIIGLQTIISRQTDLTKEAAVISIGKISGGVRNNIIPEELEMFGTIRTLDVGMQQIIHDKIKLTVEKIAESQGAEAVVTIGDGYPVTKNDVTLVKKMLNTMEYTAGENNVRVIPASTGAEDFSFFTEKVPALYFFLGGKPLNVATVDSPPHHTPDFYIDESGMLLGVRTFCNLVVDFGK